MTVMKTAAIFAYFLDVKFLAVIGATSLVWGASQRFKEKQ
jgi:hypothetical protein